VDAILCTMVRADRLIIFVALGLDGIIVKSVSGVSEDILIRLTDGLRRFSTPTLSNVGPSKDTGP
jgi:hypothetical protein